MRGKGESEQDRGGTRRHTVLIAEAVVVGAVVVDTTIRRMLAVIKVVEETFVLFPKETKT